MVATTVADLAGAHKEMAVAMVGSLEVQVVEQEMEVMVVVTMGVVAHWGA